MSILDMFKKSKSSDSHYLTGKEVRAIAKENSKIMMELERKKHRKAPESEFVSEMKDEKNILEIEDLHTYFFTEQGVVKAVNGVSINIPQNSVVGVVGESGCGKSVTSMSVMQLLQGPTGQIYSGSIRFKSLDFKRDENGNPIPVYETDENGNTVYTEEKDKRGNVKLDKDGNPVMVPVQKINASGVYAYEMEEKVFDVKKYAAKALRCFVKQSKRLHSRLLA